MLNPAAPFARAPPGQQGWLEQGASSPEPGVMNTPPIGSTPPSRPESGEANVQVWKLDPAAVENSNETQEPSDRQQPLQSFTLQETLFVEQLAAIDERVRNQVIFCSFFSEPGVFLLFFSEPGDF